MPNNKSAEKRVKVAANKAVVNKAARTQLKTQIKKAEEAIVNDADDKVVVLRETEKVIDKASAKGLLHKKTAARKKSALARKAAL